MAQIFYPLQSPFFSDRRSAWFLLFILAFFARFAFIAKTHITFTADEASCLNHALHFADPEWNERQYPSTRLFDGVRYWIAIFLYRLSGHWLKAGAFEAILFNLTGCALWVYWAHRNVSTRSAWIMGIFLAIPPACMDYYATLLERRQGSFVIGAVMVLGWNQWFSKPSWSFLFGALIGLGFWEDPFVLAFILALIMGSFYDKKKIPRTTRGLIFFFLGSALLLGYGLVRERVDPQYPPGYLTYGFSSFSTIFYRIGLLLEAFPQFWNDNMPYGYLQASVLGQSLDPVIAGWPAVFFKIWTGILFAAAFMGYGSAIWGRSGKKAEAVKGLVPMLALMFFFLLSDHVWDALCFRYFNYFPVFAALGLAFLFERTPASYRKTAGLFLALALLIQSVIYFDRIHRIPARHPAERIIGNLNERQLRAGWANGWVSGIVNFNSHDQICLNQYNFKPTDRKAEWLAYNSPRIAVVVVDGLDQPKLISELLADLFKLGYKPFGRWDFQEGWHLFELHKSVAPGKLLKDPKKIIVP